MCRRVLFRRRVGVFLLLAVFLPMLVACGKPLHPAEQVAVDFFSAVRSQDPDLLRGLLEQNARGEFEAAMGDAELVTYLQDANRTLRAQYGDDWHTRLKVLDATPGASRSEGIPWSVRVTIGNEEDSEQSIPVLETAEGFWLDIFDMTEE